jgi:hypothetical protein
LSILEDGVKGGVDDGRTLLTVAPLALPSARQQDKKLCHILGRTEASLPQQRGRVAELHADQGVGKAAKPLQEAIAGRGEQPFQDPALAEVQQVPVLWCAVIQGPRHGPGLDGCPPTGQQLEQGVRRLIQGVGTWQSNVVEEPLAERVALLQLGEDSGGGGPLAGSRSPPVWVGIGGGGSSLVLWPSPPARSRGAGAGGGGARYAE